MPKAIIFHMGAILLSLTTLVADEKQAGFDENIAPTESQISLEDDKNTVIPETSTAALIGLAGLALIFRRRL